MTRPILVASDGGAGSEGALRTGLALARRQRRELRVIGVLRPIPRYPVADLTPIPDGYAVYETVHADSLKLSLAEQVRGLGAEELDWSITVQLGNPAVVIARHAREIRAKIIMLGRGQRLPMDRWLGNETGLKVVRLATAPVLVVPPTATELPRRAVVGIDFSEHSLNAAHEALDVLGDHPHIFLAHLMWPAVELDPLPSLQEWRSAYRKTAESRLGEMATRLRKSRPMDIDCLVAEGDPAEEMLGIATRLNVDMVAAGSHGSGFLGRLLLGSVSTRLIRGASNSVLIAPPESMFEGDELESPAR